MKRAILAAVLTLGGAPAPRAAEITIGGVPYRISKGDAFRREGNAWVLATHLYDPDFYAKNYVEKEGRIFRQAEGRLWEVGRTFRAGFEDANSVRDLIGERHRWTAFTLQSPRAPTVKDYVALRRAILGGEGDFLDNRLEVGTFEGRRALKCTSVAKSGPMVCCKSSISTELVHFVKGDDLWYAASYYFAEGMPLSIVDFESSWIDQHPGPRVFIDDGGCAYVELKWADKPKYRQPSEARVPLPRRTWVRLKVHLKLSDAEDGVIEFWQDGVRLIRARGRTLPLADAVLNSLEVGISANASAATLYVHDVVLSDRPDGG